MESDRNKSTYFKTIGPIAKPEKFKLLRFTKTRSGKIMRRILRKIVAGETDNFVIFQHAKPRDCQAYS